MLASSAIGAQAFVEEALRWLPVDGSGTSLFDSVLQDIVPTPSEHSLKPEVDCGIDCVGFEARGAGPASHAVEPPGSRAQWPKPAEPEPKR